MFKIVTVILMAILVFGCGDSKKKAEIIKEDAQIKQVGSNILNESISLLAVKYEIAEDRLKQILTDYENMAFGFSSVEVVSLVVDKQLRNHEETKENVDVKTALNMVSEKYGIDKKVLSALIIEWKSLKR